MFDGLELTDTTKSIKQQENQPTHAENPYLPITSVSKAGVSSEKNNLRQDRR